MLSREDFVFTIGFDGNAALVDARAKREYGKLSTTELAEKGLFRAAYSSALYSGNTEELRGFMDSYNAQAGTSYKTVEAFSKFFGVYKEKIEKTVTY